MIILISVPEQEVEGLGMVGERIGVKSPVCGDSQNKVGGVLGPDYRRVIDFLSCSPSKR